MQMSFGTVLKDIVRQAQDEAGRSKSSIRIRGTYYNLYNGELDEHIKCDFDVQVTPDGVSCGPNIPWPGYKL
jgi:hypothetical protein